MLSKATTQLTEEVFGYFGEEDKQKAKKEPEALLISLLLVLKKELPDVSSMLSDVEEALYEDNLKKARERLAQSK